MRATRLIAVISTLTLVIALFTGCDSTEATTPSSSTTAITAADDGEETAAATETTPTTAEEIEKLHIPIIAKGSQHNFWQLVKQGAEAAAKDYNVDITFSGPASEEDIESQVQILNAALENDPAAICLAALDTQEVLPALEKASKRDIPVIGFDSSVDSDIITSSISTNNKAAAAEAGHRLAKLIGEEGQVFVLVHNETTLTGIQRRDGFLEAMTSYPNIEVLQTQYGDGEISRSIELAKAVLNDNPDIKGIFADNEGSITGCINAVTEMDLKGKVQLVGFDSGKVLLDAIKDGTVAGAVTQDPYAIGYETVKAAVMAINDEEIPKIIDVGFHWYTVDDLEDPELETVLYE